MKRLAMFALLLLSLSACRKDDVTDKTGNTLNQITDPIQDKILAKDTIKSGDKWGLTIGQSATELYAKIQAMKSDKQITGMVVVGNVFSSLDSIATRLPLYQAVYLDEKAGTGTGIQIAFADDKVKSIFTNDGIQLSSWPQGSPASTAVVVGDPIGGVYAKLVNIKKVTAYASKFERISIYFKDVNKAYDPVMAFSSQWYFAANNDTKTYTLIFLNMYAGKLVSIYATLYERS